MRRRLHFVWWLARFLAKITWGESDTLVRATSSATVRNPTHSAITLRGLAEQLEARAADPRVSLPENVRVKCSEAIAACRRYVDRDPTSAAWALRQVCARIQSRGTR